MRAAWLDSPGVVIQPRGYDLGHAWVAAGPRVARRCRRWALAALVLLAAAPAPALASGGGLHVIPFPGTPDAAPSTTIIFSSLRPSEINSVLVTGSSSRAHDGHLTALPDGAYDETDWWRHREGVLRVLNASWAPMARVTRPTPWSTVSRTRSGRRRPATTPAAVPTSTVSTFTSVPTPRTGPTVP